MLEKLAKFNINYKAKKIKYVKYIKNQKTKKILNK